MNVGGIAIMFVVWKFAQWLHVNEAYSTIVTGASALPSTWSPSAPALKRSAGLNFLTGLLACAKAAPGRKFVAAAARTAAERPALN